MPNYLATFRFFEKLNERSRTGTSAGVLGLCLFVAVPAMAQPEPRWEIGALFPVLHLADHEGTDAGLGGRVTYNVTEHFAVESELNLFPRELARTPRAPSVPLSTDRRVQALFGIKAGTRWDGFGLFAKLRPGLVDFRNQLHVVCVTHPCPPLASSQTELAVDAGGGVELYLSRRFAVRVDAGDLWINGTGNDILRADDDRVTRDLGHNFQWTTAFVIRF